MSQASDDRRTWADKFLEQQTAIVSRVLNVPVEQITIAPKQQDYYEASDLILPGDVRVAVRVRKADRIEFLNDICFRNVRYPGTDIPTEYQKMIFKGFAKFMLTCWADADEEQLTHWHMVDLDEFRRCQKETWLVGVRQTTFADGVDKGLLAFDLRSFPSQYKLAIAKNFAAEF